MSYMLQRRAWTSMDAVTTHMQRGLISCVARGSWTSARAITASIVALLCGVHARGLRIGQLSILRHSLWLHLSNVGIYPAISARGRYQYLCTPGWLRGRYRFAVALRPVGRRMMPHLSRQQHNLGTASGRFRLPSNEVGLVAGLDDGGCAVRPLRAGLPPVCGCSVACHGSGGAAVPLVGRRLRLGAALRAHASCVDQLRSVRVRVGLGDAVSMAPRCRSTPGWWRACWCSDLTLPSSCVLGGVPHLGAMPLGLVGDSPCGRARLTGTVLRCCLWLG